MIHLRPPMTFNFHEPQGWTRWKARFDQCRLASGLSGEEEAKQVSTFLYCLGEEAQDFLLTIGVTDADCATYNAICTKFDNFFKVRHNVIYKCTRFNCRTQQSGETAEFIVAVHTLASNCRFGAMKDELIRDRLDAGIRDSELAERLQLNVVLTLSEAVEQIRQHKAVHENQKEMRLGDTKETTIVVDAVKRRNRRDFSCQRCGRNDGPRRDCSARDTTY